MKDIRMICDMLSNMKALQNASQNKIGIIDAQLSSWEKDARLHLDDDLFRRCFEKYDAEPFDAVYDKISTFVDGVEVFALVKKEGQK